MTSVQHIKPQPQNYFLLTTLSLSNLTLVRDCHEFVNVVYTVIFLHEF